MTDPPGLPAGLGIEGVQWLAEGEENLTVRITGRWRRRPTSSAGQPLLVIEDSQGRRHRFPAMPEPPSLTGAAPGTWRMSFSVPASLGPPVTARAWLQLGAAAIPLPQGERPASSTGPADPDTLAERRLRSSELAVEAARRRAAEAEDAAAELAIQVERLEHELDRLRAQLAERERDSRVIEQRGHAERMLREELQEELAEFTRQQHQVDAAFEQLAAADTRTRELEVEVGRLRRRLDEAEHLAAAARAARQRAERRLDEVSSGSDVPKSGAGGEERPAGGDERGTPGLEPRPGPDPRIAEALRAELALAAGTGPAERTALPRAELPQATSALRLEREMTARLREAHPRGEVEAGTPSQAPVEPVAQTPAAEAVAHAPAAEAPAQAPAAESHSASSLSSVLAALREELKQLRMIAEGERAARIQAQEYASALELQLQEYAARCARAYGVIEELRDQLEDLREAYASLRPKAGEPLAQSEGHAGPAITPERLQAAFSRLREGAMGEAPGAVEAAGQAETGPPTELESGGTAERSSLPAAEPAVRASRPWLGTVLRALLIRDPAAAGRLVLALLPAQRLVYRHGLSYDLVITGLGCARVDGATSPEEPTRVEITDAPRGQAEVEFQLTGDLPGLARLVLAGRLRQRLGWKTARVQGDRRALRALTGFIETPLSLAQLDAAGVRIDPMLSLTVIALMIDPIWTRGERFTIAYQSPGGAGTGAYLTVRDGRPITVSEAAPANGPVTTIVGPPGSLLPLLSGADRPEMAIEGDVQPVTVLRSWLNRAQSG